MNKTIFGIIISVVAVVGIAGLVMANNKSEKSSTQETAQHTDKPGDHKEKENSSAAKDTGEAKTAAKVDIKDFEFAPKTIKVKKGAVVTWTNQDSAKHDVTPDQESADFKASELLAKGEDYSFTFNKVGKFDYHCSPHPYMKASVEVVE